MTASERYIRRFTTGTLSSRLREQAIECIAHIETDILLQNHPYLAAWKSKHDALIKAADILDTLKGQYEEPYNGDEDLEKRS